MTQYVALHWCERDEISPRIGWVRRTVAQDDRWRAVIDEPGRLVAVRAERELDVRRLANGVVVIGDLFARSGTRPTLADLQAEPPEPEAFCSALADRYWGRYVVLGAPERGRAWVFRDPMGALDCVTFEAAGAEVVASALPDWLLIGLAPSLSIDWTRLASFLVQPAAIAAGTGLNGLGSVMPGELVAEGGGVAIWRPDQAAQRQASKGEDLAELLTCCVGALARGRRVLAEASGGLDSAIVTTALAQSGASEVSTLINYHTDEPEGDECRYAREVARAAGLPLIERRKPDFELSERALLEVADAPRPAIWALDAALDRDLALECEAQGADLLMTGKGGDTVFYQMATPLILADHLRAQGLRGLFGPVWPDLARWTRRSTWSVLGAAIAGGGGSRRRAPHPWLEGLDGTAPGKRLQLHGLASCLTFSGATRRGLQAHLVHPLLSQPVVEHCLALSSVELTDARRDRAYARRSFASQLPPAVASRYGKGDATAHFGRAIASNLEFLRSFLLDGLLVANGVLDRRRLDRLLNAENLIWRGGARQITHAIVVEAWARGWTRRLRGLE